MTLVCKVRWFISRMPLILKASFYEHSDDLIEICTWPWPHFELPWAGTFVQRHQRILRFYDSYTGLQRFFCITVDQSVCLYVLPHVFGKKISPVMNLEIIGKWSNIDYWQTRKKKSLFVDIPTAVDFCSCISVMELMENVRLPLSRQTWMKWDRKVQYRDCTYSAEYVLCEIADQDFILNNQCLSEMSKTWLRKLSSLRQCHVWVIVSIWYRRIKWYIVDYSKE